MLPRHEASDPMPRGMCRVGVCASLQASSVPASVFSCSHQPHLGGLDLLVCLGGGSEFGGYDGVQPQQERGHGGQEGAGSLVGGGVPERGSANT